MPPAPISASRREGAESRVPTGVVTTGILGGSAWRGGALPEPRRSLSLGRPPDPPAPGCSSSRDRGDQEAAEARKLRRGLTFAPISGGFAQAINVDDVA